MALSLDEIDEITKRNPHSGEGDRMELSVEDETVLDEAWTEIAKEKKLKRVKKSAVQTA